MKIFLLTLSFFLLTACTGAERQVLPPELQGGPLVSNLPPVAADPLAEFPQRTKNTSLDRQIEPATQAVSEPEITVPAEFVNAASCEALTQDLETSFADINFCDINDDCAVALGSCPFGCYLFHNNKINFADYQPALTAYQENCNPCVYKCAAAPRVNDRRCVEGRCVDTRYDS